MLTIVLLAAMEKALLMMFAFVIVMGGMGLYEAWRNKRGVLGWIVSLLISIAGGVAGMVLCVAIADVLIRRPSTMAIGEGVNILTPILMLTGSWLALRFASRFR